MSDHLFPPNPYREGTVAFEQREGATRVLATEVSELVALWVNGNRGTVLDELVTLGNRTVATHATLVAAVVSHLETEEDAEFFLRSLAERSLP